MKEFLMAMVTIVIIEVLVEVILVDGETKKYIQAAMSLMVLLTFLCQLSILLKKDYTLPKIDEEAQQTISIDTKTLNNLHLLEYDNALNNITNTLENEGIEGVLITFNYIYDSDGTIYIEKIFVDTSNIVINENTKNININEKIIEICKSYINIDEERIIVYGKEE